MVKTAVPNRVQPSRSSVEAAKKRKELKREKRKASRKNRTTPYPKIYKHDKSTEENFLQFVHIGIDYGLNDLMTEDEMRGFVNSMN